MPLFAQEIAQQTAPEPAPRVRVPAMTAVVIRFDAELGSNISKTGDRFTIAVAEDVRVGEHLLIPAGTPGEGEVVHAARSGMGGKAGELVVAARFVRIGDVQVRLRSTTLGRAGAGKDQTDNATAAAILLGPVGLMVKGGKLVLPRDALATCKTAEEVQLPVAPTPPVESTEGGAIDEKQTT